MHTLSSYIYNPMKTYVLDNSSDYRYNILARSAHLILIPISFTTAAIDIKIGILIGAVSALTLGLFPTMNCIAHRYLKASTKLVNTQVLHVIGFLNPISFIQSEANLASRDVLDLTTLATNSFWYPLAEDLKNSDYFICRHIFSRLTFALLPISSVVTIAVDCIIPIVKIKL